MTDNNIITINSFFYVLLIAELMQTTNKFLTLKTILNIKKNNNNNIK